MYPTMKNVTMDNNNEELVNFAKTIDFTELFDHIKTFAGVDCKFYQPEITTKRGDVYISLMSDDIAAQTGAFAAILRSCYLSSFSNRVIKDQETNELFYWVIVSIQYDQKGGGSNGMNVVSAWYKNGEWTFSDAGERR
jgi:hypothetical protein